MTTGILLVNLGTPDSPQPRDVKRYLNEFLTDGRVIDIAPLPRQLLVRGMIVPRRYKESAKAYREIWTEEGSPLLVHGKRVRDLLQVELGDTFQVELAMRYQNPSIASALARLKAVRKLVILPLFPQYASATTGSVHQRVMEVLSTWQTIPETRFVNSYPTQPEMIAAFAERARAFDLDSYDHILMSFHGLPERHIRKADQTGKCLTPGCCERNVPCYRAQCIATARAIAAHLELEPDQYSVAFQSRLGKDPWLQPYTSDVIRKFKRLLVFCPAFVADCLETLYEIREEYGQELVPSLNDHPLWIKGLAQLATFDKKVEKVYTS